MRSSIMSSTVTRAGHSHSTLPTHFATSRTTVPKLHAPTYHPIEVTTTTVSLATVSYANCLLMTAAIALALTENNRYYDQSYDEDALTDALRLGLMAISLVQVGLICKKYALVRKNNAKNTEETRRNPLLIPLLEMGIHLMVLPPRVNMEIRFYLLGISSILSLSDLALLICLLRLYHVLYLIYVISRFSSSKAHFHA